MLQAVQRASAPGAEIDPRLAYRAAASGANESVASDGGYLVQNDFASELLQITHNTGQLVSRVRHIPVSAGSNSLKINGINETSRASGSRWGGVQTYWAAEADTVTASRPRFRQIELNMNKLFGLFYATDELLADAAALESVAMAAFSEEFGFKLDDGIIRGTGAGQPLGVLNSPALVSVAKETGQAAASIVVENLDKMWSRCGAIPRQRGGRTTRTSSRNCSRWA
jgi:HK97 family phage major capsid protein